MTNAVLSKLRAFVGRSELESCDECGGALAHTQPLLEPARRRVVRVCSTCAAALAEQSEPEDHKSGARFLRVRRSVRRLGDFELPSAVWIDLEVPIGLAYFRVRSRTGEVLVTFPGRAGLIEAFVPLRAWQRLEQINPELKTLRPDVEALLVRRSSRHRDYFRVSIDYCYELCAVLRGADAVLPSPEHASVQSFIHALDELADKTPT